MTKITIKTDEVGCRKPGCTRRLTIPQRHHRRNEGLIIAALRGSGLSRTKRWKELKERYDQFHPDDIIRLCEAHHVEIHHRYDAIVSQFCASRKRAIGSLSWKEFDQLMDLCEAACREWEKEQTPGSKQTFQSQRQRRRRPRR